MQEEYKNYLEHWDTTSSVRARQNTYRLDAATLNTELGERAWFTESGVPIMQHPLLAALEPAAQQRLLGLLRLQFCEFGTVLEHVHVNITTMAIAQGDHGLDVPDIMRRDAYKVYTDEAYHALFSMEAAVELRHYLGLGESQWPLEDSRLDAIADAVSDGTDDERFLLRFGATLVTEIMISKELAANMKGIVVEPIYNMFRDHLHDESRHALYFTALFGVLWPQFGARERLFLGTALPQLLLAFNQIDEKGILHALELVGFDRATGARIIADSYPADYPVQRARARASSALRLFQKYRLFEIPEVNQAFVQAGFVAAT